MLSSAGAADDDATGGSGPRLPRYGHPWGVPQLFYFRLLLAAIAIAATAAIVLIDVGVWRAAPEGLIVVAAVTVGLLAGSEEAAKAIAMKKEKGEDTFTRNVYTALGAALVNVSSATGLGCEQLGLSCFLVPTWFRRVFPYRLRKFAVRWLLPRWLAEPVANRAAPALRRVVRLRLSGYPAESAIEWTRGKGVVGKCWRNRHDVEVNSYQLYKDLLTCSREEWDNLHSNITLGLDYNEFKRIRGKYGAVVVSPIIFDDHEFVGCITLDTPFDDYWDAVWTDDVREVLGNTARNIASYLK